MNILTNYQNTTPEYKPVQPVNVQTKNVQKVPEYKPDILDIVSDKIVDRSDLTDMVTMPRAIFKGYLCFTVGTAIGSIAGTLKEGKFSKGLSIASSLISIYGTYNFVKGFLIRDKNLTETGK